ncbi:hypothetical protein RFI_20313, partial [Reticulomyxa filosa]
MTSFGTVINMAQNTNTREINAQPSTLFETFQKQQQRQQMLQQTQQQQQQQQQPPRPPPVPQKGKSLDKQRLPPQPLADVTPGARLQSDSNIDLEEEDDDENDDMFSNTKGGESVPALPILPTHPSQTSYNMSPRKHPQAKAR